MKNLYWTVTTWMSVLLAGSLVMSVSTALPLTA